MVQVVQQLHSLTKSILQRAPGLEQQRLACVAQALLCPLCSRRSMLAVLRFSPLGAMIMHAASCFLAASWQTWRWRAHQLAQRAVHGEPQEGAGYTPRQLQWEQTAMQRTAH